MATFLIAANKDKKWEKTWTINFFVYFMIDVLIAPILIWAFKYIYSWIMAEPEKVYKVLSKVNDTRFSEAYVPIHLPLIYPQAHKKKTTKIYPTTALPLEKPENNEPPSIPSSLGNIIEDAAETQKLINSTSAERTSFAEKKGDVQAFKPEVQNQIEQSKAHFPETQKSIVDDDEKDEPNPIIMAFNGAREIEDL